MLPYFNTRYCLKCFVKGPGDMLRFLASNKVPVYLLLICGLAVGIFRAGTSGATEPVFELPMLSQRSSDALTAEQPTGEPNDDVDSPRVPVPGSAAPPVVDVGTRRGQGPRQGTKEGPLIAEEVRKATQLVADGERDKAKELIQGLIRECETASHGAGDCSRWLRSLQGLSQLFPKTPERKTINNALNMKLVRIPAGEYMMGSLKQEMDWLRLTFKKTWREGHKQWFEDELPLHPVRITKGFYIGTTAVTVGQFREFVRSTNYKTEAEKNEGGMIYNSTESRWVAKKDMKWSSVPWQIADNQPVVFVSWNDAQEFCKWLSRKEKRKYRLPTEAEWEMCCRGGLVWSRFGWGNRLPGDHDLNFGDGNPNLPESLIMVNDGYKYVSPVGSYPPNGFGLYDMEGNVMQWVEDRYERNYYQNSPLDDPKGPAAGSSRVNKGGNWYASPEDCRCAFRGFSGPEMSFWNLGFRVVLEEDSTEGQTPDTESAKNRTDYGPSEDEGLALFRQAMFAAQQRRFDDAIEDLEKALKVYEKRQDLKWTSRVRSTLAGIYAERNQKFKAKELATKALAEFRQIGDQNSVKLILRNLIDLQVSPGVKIVEVKKDGPGDQAGLVADDIIIEYAGETGFRREGFKSLVNDYSRTAKVTLSVLHDEEIHCLSVPGGELGVAVEDIKRLPQRRGVTQDRPQPPRDQGGRRNRSRAQQRQQRQQRQ